MVNNKQQELAQTQRELAQTQRELGQTQRELGQTQTTSQQEELSQKERELSQKERELSQKERELSEEISKEQTLEQSSTKLDISEQFETKQYEQNGQSYKEISGSLGAPGTVVEHRNQSEQSAISRGTGDDAGHLIGNRFGAPGDERNLSAQNWKANRFGTYKELENNWADKLSQGYKVDVTVKDITRNNEDRAFMRDVSWTETDPNGKEQDYNLAFANTTTPQSREKTAEKQIEETIGNERKQENQNSFGM